MPYYGVGFHKTQMINDTTEVFRNEILPAWQKGLNGEVILISEFILISEITNSEKRITSTLRYFCQAGKLAGFHFEKSLMIFVKMINGNQKKFIWV